MKPSRLVLVAVLGLFGCTQAPEPAPPEEPVPAEVDKPAPGSPGESPTEAVSPAEGEAPPEKEPPAETVPPAETGAPSEEETKPRSLLNMPPEYKEVVALYAQASKALREGNTSEAEDLLDRVLALQPHHLQAVLAKARICREDERYDEAIGVLDRAIEAGQKHVSVLYQKALVLHEGGDSAAALDQLYLVLEQGDSFPNARYLRAVILAESGDRDGALTALEDAVDNGFLDARRLESDDAFAFIRDDKRFQSLVAEVRAELEARKKSGDGPSPGATTPVQIAPPVSDSLELAVDLEYTLRRRLGSDLSFEFVGSDGKPLRLADYEGQAVLVFCWTPSKESLEFLEDLTRLQEELGDEGLKVITLCRDAHPEPEGAEENVRSYLKSFKIDLPCASIRDADATRLRVGAYPTTLFVGRDGKVYQRASGRLVYDSLARLTRLLVNAHPEREPETDTEPETEEQPETPPEGEADTE